MRISPRVAFIPALNSAPGRAVFPERGATAAQLRGMGREKRAGGGRREWGRDFPQGFAGAAERGAPCCARRGARRARFPRRGDGGGTVKAEVAWRAMLRIGYLSQPKGRLGEFRQDQSPTLPHPRFQVQEATKVSTFPRRTREEGSPQAPGPPSCPPRVGPSNSAPLIRQPLAGYRGRASSVPACSASLPSRVPEPADPERGKRRGGARPPKGIGARDRKGADRRPHSSGRTARGAPSSPTHSCAGAKEPAPQCSGLRVLRGCGRLRLLGSAGARGLREPAAGAESQPGARGWVPPQPRAQWWPTLSHNLALGSRDEGDT